MSQLQIRNILLGEKYLVLPMVFGRNRYRDFIGVVDISGGDKEVLLKMFAQSVSV